MNHEIHGAMARLRARRGAVLIAPGFNRPAMTRRQETHGPALVNAACMANRATVPVTDAATGKLAFVWGLCGFTTDEVTHDRWVMT